MDRGRELVLTHEHLPPIGSCQTRRVFVAMSANDDFDMRVNRTRDLDHLARVGALRRRDD